MRLSGNTVLITGGASGIGLAFAEAFLDAGSTVIICGRRAKRLDEVHESHPRIHWRVCDISGKGIARSWPIGSRQIFRA